MIPFSTSFVHSIFPSVTWNAPNEGVCLTFDDGPHPKATPAVLETLASYGTKATFFFLGHNVAKYPQIARDVAQRGHTVGNHSHDHSLLLFRNHRYIVNQICSAAEQIKQATGKRPTLFRPPYGYFRPTILPSVRSTGHRIVMWNLDSRDWRERSADTVSESIIRKVRPGGIVLLHDNDRTADRIQDIVKMVLDSLLAVYQFSALPP